MPRYVLGIFPAYEEAEKASQLIEQEKLSNEMMILNKLGKFDDDNTPKVDGIISGVSDVFLGLPAFVNPMSVVGVPPQSPETTNELVESQWDRYGFSKDEAYQYQDIMKQGKTILAVMAEQNERPVIDLLNRSGAEEIRIH